MEKKEILTILTAAKPYYHDMEIINQDALLLDEEEKKIPKGMSRNQILIGICLTIFLYFIPGIIYFCIVSSKASKQTQQRREEINTQKQMLIDRAESVIANLRETGINQLFPQEIWGNLYDMQHIYSFFELGRADSIKEALNLLEESNHRARMENMQGQMLQQQQQTNQQLFWGNMINAGNALNNVLK